MNPLRTRLSALLAQTEAMLVAVEQGDMEGLRSLVQQRDAELLDLRPSPEVEDLWRALADANERVRLKLLSLQSQLRSELLTEQRNHQLVGRFLDNEGSA